MGSEWDGFTPGAWVNHINVRDFIQRNYVPYEGHEKFLVGATPQTIALQTSITAWTEQQRQADQDIKPSPAPPGEGKAAEVACSGQKAAGTYRCGCQVCKAEPSSNPARGVGDCRQVALYGIDFLIDQYRSDLAALRLTQPEAPGYQSQMEQLSAWVEALMALQSLAQDFGCEVGRPALNTREVLQWIYFVYLTEAQTSNSPARMSRISTFLDIYCDRDLRQGYLTETELQELIDQFVGKLRLLAFTSSRQSGQTRPSGLPLPTFMECLGGMGKDGRPLVTRTSFRFLNTLMTLGVAPQPTFIVLWSTRLPPAFKQFCTRLTLNTNAVQYVNDDLLRPLQGDDYAGPRQAIPAFPVQDGLPISGNGWNCPTRDNTVTSLEASHQDGSKQVASQISIQDNPGGAIAALSTVTQTSKPTAQNGATHSLFIQPSALGKTPAVMSKNLEALLDQYTQQGGRQLSVNVVHRQTLVDAMVYPELYPHLLIGLSGHTTPFTQLSKQTQQAVLQQTFYNRL
jgi:pyruvate-formate lyase